MKKKIETSKNHYNTILNSHIEEVFKLDTTKNKKYVEYILNTIKTKNITKISEVREITKNILKFEVLLPYIDRTERNIYSPLYRDYTFLCERINYYAEIMDRKIFDKNKDLYREILFEDDDFIFIYIKTHEGATKYGRGTKWCITDKKIFNRYNTYNCFYFLINKNEDSKVKKNYRKLAFVLPRKTKPPTNNVRIYNVIDNTTDYEAVNRYSKIDHEILFETHITMITHLFKLNTNNPQNIFNKKNIIDEKVV